MKDNYAAVHIFKCCSVSLMNNNALLMSSYFYRFTMVREWFRLIAWGSYQTFWGSEANICSEHNSRTTVSGRYCFEHDGKHGAGYLCNWNWWKTCWTFLYIEVVSVDPTNVRVQFNYESGTTSTIWTTLYYFIQMVNKIYFEKKKNHSLSFIS